MRRYSLRYSIVGRILGLKRDYGSLVLHHGYYQFNDAVVNKAVKYELYPTKWRILIAAT